MKQKLTAIISGILIVIIVLLGIGLIIGTTLTLPSNAQLYVDDINKVYYAPTYIQNNVLSIDGLRLTTEKDKSIKFYSPDDTCRNQEYFMQNGRSMTGLLLEKVGILHKLKSRWNKDGTWNY